MFSLPKKDNKEVSLESLESYLLVEGNQSDLLSNILTLDELDDLHTLNVSSSEIENYLLHNASIETLLID